MISRKLMLSVGFGALLALCAALVYFTAFSTKQAGVIRVGISPFQDTYLLKLAQRNHFFEEEGLKIELKSLDWNVLQQHLVSGDVDVIINNISSVIAVHSSAPDVVYAYGFNTFDDGFALIIRPTSPIRPISYFLNQGHSRAQAIKETAAQLAGKKVVTTSNTDMEQGVAAAARRGGLDFKKDITILNYPPALGLAAFLHGEGDAYIGGIPQRASADRQGMIEMLTGSDLGPAPINGYVTTQRFAKDHAEELAKLLHVWFRTVDYVNKNIDRASNEMAEELQGAGNTGFTSAEFQNYWNKIEHYPASPSETDEQILKPTGKNYWKARWDDCNTYFVETTGRIPERVDPSEAFIMYDIQKVYVQK